MNSYSCASCGNQWPENYCPECGRTIERPSKAGPAPSTSAPPATAQLRLKRCTYCGKELEGNFSVCPVDDHPLVVLGGEQNPMPPEEEALVHLRGWVSEHKPASVCRYYVRQRGEDEIRGAFDIAELQSQLRSGTLSASQSMVLGDSGQTRAELEKHWNYHWIPISELPALEQFFPKAPGECDSSSRQKFEVTVASGQIVTYNSGRLLRSAMLAGTLPKELQARRLIVTEQGKRTEGSWKSLEKLACEHPELRSVYRPIWHYTMKFAGYGAIAGVGLKAIDTTLLIFTLDQRAGFLWLLIIAALLFSKQFPYGIPLIIFFSFKFGIRHHLFLAALSTMLIGIAFGTPAGMILGSVVGHFKAPGIRRAPDALSEGRRPYLLGILLPFLALAVLVPSYIWLNVKIIKWLESM